MFRSDRDALSDKVDELRIENERLRHENEAMRHELLARRAADPTFGSRNAVYKNPYLGDAERAVLSRHGLRAFPIWATVVTHVFSLGIASWIRFNVMHDQLPKAEHDDPTAFKAIALHLAPYFNMYWVFFNGLRLTDRVNLQLRLRDEAPTIDRRIVIGAGVASVIPYVNFVLAPIVWLAVAIQMQRAVNRIVEIDEARRAATADASAERVRFPDEMMAPGKPAESDPTARDVAAEAEAEASEILAAEAPSQAERAGGVGHRAPVE